MKLMIESTDDIVELHGVPMRVWRGTTLSGGGCAVLVGAIAVHQGEDCAQFDSELICLHVQAEADGTPSVLLNWQCSGCRWGFRGPWQKVCPACGREDYWTGSVDPSAREYTATEKTDSTERQQ